MTTKQIEAVENANKAAQDAVISAARALEYVKAYARDIENDGDFTNKMNKLRLLTNFVGQRHTGISSLTSALVLMGSVSK